MFQSIECWLRLALVPRFGAKAAHALLNQYTIENLLDFDENQWISAGFNRAQANAFLNPNQQIIDNCLQWCSKENRHILTFSDPLYPYLLKQISSAPIVLFIKGDPQLLSLPQLAIVGSRNASQNGLANAYEFALKAIQHDLVITSGLALGIDGRAHRGALDGNGKTIAVLGSGLERIYPSLHQGLAQEISENGALVSEFWPWSAPQAAFFPKRNRVISGLSLGVLVAEAALKSGSLITARLALEQGRDVFALPGSIHDPYVKGTNGLIKQGAFLVESIEEILEQINIIASCAINHHLGIPQALELQEKLPFHELLANVGDEARCVDVLAERCSQPVHEIMIQLLELELQGLVSAVPGGYVRTRRG